MIWLYYAQQIVFITIDATLFAIIVLRLLTPPRRTGVSERRTRKTLGFLCIAMAFLGLVHLRTIGVQLVAHLSGGQLWGMLGPVSSVLAIMFYGGFGLSLAAAIGQILKATPPEGTAEPRSDLQSSPAETSRIRTQPTREQTDWGYLWKQIRIGFFRIIGFVLLIGAAPLAFAQEIPGVGVMALITGVGCLWLGFHRKSPLAIKYASLAEEESS